MIKFFTSLVALCLLMLAIVSGNDGIAVFKVLSPKELKDKFEHLEGVSVTVGNFGNVPWGRTVMGNLYYADPADACTQLNQSNITKSGSGNSIEAEAPIIIADRGGCTFVMKAQNAQLAGAKLLIVTDNRIENVSFVMPVDDGHGGALNIPLVMINKVTGNLFEEYVRKSEQVAISVKFPMPKAFDHIEYEIWLSSSDMNSFDIIKDLSAYQDILKDKARMKPHYAVWYSPECETRGFKECNNPNCVSGGRYCSPDPDGNGPLSGVDTLKEDLRQICIHIKDPDAWWKYHTLFSKSCLNSVELESCSYATIQSIKSSKDISKDVIQKCVSDSFSEGNIMGDNRILSDERRAFKERGILTWPTIVINNQTYRGNLEPASLIFKAMCEGFSEKPLACDEPTINPQSYPNQVNVLPKIAPKKSNSHVLLIISVVLLAAIVFFIVFICYKRQMKKEILQEMNYQISSTMHRYMAMKDEGEGIIDKKGKRTEDA